ncbi:MAG: HYR domain-containing protein, partial [Saprospiraceae bacterium]
MEKQHTEFSIISNFPFYFILISLLIVVQSSSIKAQPCVCDINLTPVDACCADLQVILGDPNCLQQVYDITVNTSSLPMGNAKIRSATGNTPITVNVNAARDLATFTSPTNLNDPLLVGTVQTIGTLCFDDAPDGFLTPQITIIDNMGSIYCQDYSEFIRSCPDPSDFKKLAGLTEDQKPSKVKAIGDGIFVANTTEVNGNEYAVFSKFDITTGAIVWQKVYNASSRFWDFAYNPATHEFIVVGQINTSNLDNSSLICRYDWNGNLLTDKVLDHNGRERFAGVVVHQNPMDVNAPIYVVGHKNPDGQPASSLDVTMLYNLNNDCTVKCYNESPEVNNVELEIRALTDLNDGNLILLGNGSIANEGVLLKVRGSDGLFQFGRYYPGNIDFYAAVQNDTNGDIFISGRDFGTKEALALVVDPIGFNVYTNGSLKFPNVDNFQEIWFDRFSHVYAIGREKANPNRHIVHQLDYNPSSHSLSLNYSKYLLNGETSFTEPHLYVSTNFDQIFYADARINASSGFGDYDILVGSLDLNFTCDCASPYSQTPVVYNINNTPVICNNPSKMVPTPTTNSIADLSYDCATYCGFDCDFTFTTSCFTVNLSGSVSMGSPPYTYQWDINCDNSFEYSGQTASHTFPSLPATGTYDICMTVTDAAGNLCTKQKQVTVSDTTPPATNCPSNITLNTDPGECYATYYLPAPTDNCDPAPTSSCNLSGATTGSGITTSSVQLNKGVTTITCFMEDASGNMTSCNFTVTVVDNEKPQISCPANISTSVPGCDGGKVVTFPNPTVSDNCPMVTWTYSHQSGDFFPCGTTTVTATATDMAGNTNTCSFNIYVQCLCAEVASTFAECNALDENAYDFAVTLNSLSGLTNPSQHCTATLTSNASNISLSNVNTIWNGTQVTFTGTATITACDFSNNLALLANINCICPNNNYNLNCSLPVSITAPCCRTLTIENDEFCKIGDSFNVPIKGINNLCDVQEVRWFIADAPCPPTSWGTPFQVTTSYTPLLLDPAYHNGDICIYAEVTVGDGDGTCKGTITTNTATITLCEPVSCSIAGQTNYCYITGNPITPAPLVASITPASPNCNYSVQWYDDNGAITGATNLTYQPPALSFVSGSKDCYRDFTYTAIITTSTADCGSQCSYTIRLYNDDSPDGTLTLDPVKNLPLCYGDDATLRYTPECAGEPPLWNWLISTDGSTFTPIATAGTQNPLRNTNRLYQDTWYRIQKKNGSCPLDELTLKIPINPPLQITAFTANASPLCNPTMVDLSVTFGPNLISPCDYLIEWYKNGQIIHSSNSQGGTANYTYTPSTAAEIAGNYYVKITNTCCNEMEKSAVVVVDPPCEVAVAGPCFRCNNQIVTLTGIVVNPIVGASCTYQWYDNNIAITGANSTSLIVQSYQSGPFRFEVTCTKNGTTCTKFADFNLKQCGLNNSALANDLLDMWIEGATESVIVYWLSANSVDLAGYHIERSNDLIEWKRLGYVLASDENRYQFIDKSPAKGTNYYRLQQVQNDGSSDYSAVRNITFATKNNQLALFPNPTKGKLELQLSSSTTSEFDLKIIDAKGKVVIAKTALTSKQKKKKV